jgi:two-component system response regulator LytT
MDCIIIDDDATARLIVRQLVENVPNFSVNKEFSNAIEAIKYLNSNVVDCVFLDIHMPTFSGFDFIKTIKNSVKIVLITSDKNFALDAFEYDTVVDYLVKPITEARFNKTIQKLEAKILWIGEAKKTTKKSTEGELYVNVDKRLVKLKYVDILLIEAKGDYIKIKTLDKNHIVHSTLKKIEEKLPSDIFLKIHRSYIINLSKIIDIEDNSVLINREVIPVSRSNKSELLKRLNLL